MWVEWYKLASFSSQFFSNYAIYIFSREMMDISHFYIMIKSKVGVDFDVAQRGTSKSTPTLFFIIETFYETKWKHWSTMYTYLAYEKFVQCNTIILKHWNIEQVTSPWKFVNIWWDQGSPKWGPCGLAWALASTFTFPIQTLLTLIIYHYLYFYHLINLGVRTKMLWIDIP